MTSRPAFVVAALLLLGCSGRTDTISGDGGSSGSSSGGGSSSSGSGGSSSGSSGGGSCVDIVLSSYDTSCHQDTDCIAITSGHLCSGTCACGGSTINVDGQGRYQQALSTIQLGECGCPLEGVPRCLGDVCTICTGSSSDPPQCGTAIDAGQSDAVACVDIDLSTYDQSCQNSSDCIGITPGQICTGSCACGGATINVSGEARYQAAIAGIAIAECPCVAAGVPTCVANQCILCTWNSSTPGCPDGG